jgi:hypothetical protein
MVCLQLAPLRQHLCFTVPALTPATMAASPQASKWRSGFSQVALHSAKMIDRAGARRRKKARQNS